MAEIDYLSEVMDKILDSLGLDEENRQRRMGVPGVTKMLDSWELESIKNMSDFPLNAGSSYEITTIDGLSSDMDCLMIFNALRVIQDIEQWIPGAERITYIIDEEDCYPSYVKLYKVSRHYPGPLYKEMVKNIPQRHNVGRDGKLYISSNLEINYHIESGSSTEPHGPVINYHADFDTVIAYPCDFFPRSALKWKERQTVETLSRVGESIINEANDCHVVPVGNKSSPDVNLEWRYSFTHLERRLVHAWNNVQYKLYVMMKLISKDLIEPLVPDVISSYHIKTILFWMNEEYKREFFEISNFNQSILTYLKNLLDTLKRQSLPHYFIEECNLYYNKMDQTTARQLTNIIQDIIDTWPWRLCNIKRRHLGSRLYNVLSAEMSLQTVCDIIKNERRNIVTFEMPEELLNYKAKDVELQTEDSEMNYIILAASHNNFEIVKMLVENGADVNVQHLNDESALVKAARHNNIEMVKILIENYADVNFKTENGFTAIILAVRNNNMNMVKMLVENDADVNVKTKDGETAIILAARNNNMNILKMLIENHADVNSLTEYGFTAIIWAISNNNMEMVKMLVENHADVNSQTEYGFTAIMWAVRNNNMEMVKFLIKNDADVNSQNEYGFTAISWAARNNNMNILNVLIENHADVNSQTKDGFTAIIWAVRNNNTEMVKLLIEKNADVNAKTENEDTPILLAARNNNMEIVKMLIDYKADVNAQTVEIAIYWATIHNNMEMTIFVFENSMNVTKQSENVGEYFKHCRDDVGWLKTIIETENMQKLKSVLAFYDATKNTNGLQGILLLAAAKGSQKICEFLMDQRLPSTSGRIDSSLSKLLFGDKEPHHVSPLAVAVHFNNIENIVSLLPMTQDSDIEMIEQQQEAVETLILKEIKKRLESRFRTKAFKVEAGFRNCKSVLVVYTISLEVNPFDTIDQSFCGRSFCFRNPRVIREPNPKIFEHTGELSVEQIEATKQIIRENAPSLWSNHSNLNIITMQASHHQCHILLFCTSKGIIPVEQNKFPKILYTNDNKHSASVKVEEGFFELCPSYETLSSKRLHQHLKMGCSIGPANPKFNGTLGPFVDIEEKLGFLTCAHVLFDISSDPFYYDSQNSGEVNVWQPEMGSVDIDQPRSDKECGTVLKAIFKTQNETSVDVAAVMITDVSRRTDEGLFAVNSRESHKPLGFDHLPVFNSGYQKDVINISTNRRAMKCGKETHLTHGFVNCWGTETKCISTTGKLDHQEIIMKNQIEIFGIAPDVFLRPGDSGSAVFQINDDTSLECIGMAIGCTSYNSAIVTPIKDILEQLGPGYSLKKFQ